MFGRAIHLFNVFGFAIRIDWSWFIILILVVWSLATGLFPTFFPGMEVGTYWIIAVGGAIGLFGSIVLHELGHALEARRHGVEMRGITLFIFGGVAEMTREPPSAKAEFLVAVAGPIVSVTIALVAFGLNWVAEVAGWSLASVAVFWYLWVINALLVAFNLIPAFPLDGGRVLRSALWHFKGDLRWATRVSSAIGGGFGIVLIVLGVFSVLGGNFIGGMWWFLLGLFLRNAAQMSYQQVLIRRALEGEPVSRFMRTEVRTVPGDVNLQDLVHDYVYRYHHKMYPVTRDGHLVGCVTTSDIRQRPRSEWPTTSVEALAHGCTEDNTISPDADAMQALARMQRTDQSRLMVVENGELRGIISLKDLLHFMSLKIELEEAEDEARTRDRATRNP